MSALIRHIFVDESGDPTLPEYNPEIPSIYVITATMVESNRLEYNERNANELVQKHAGAGELKSSSIGSNVERRKIILSDIVASGLQYYCFAVDKARIRRESGLRFRRSFYKFLHSIFYNRIREACIELNITADIHGDSDFMEGFKKYILDFNYLFNRFQFLPSKDVPLLQITDVIAGSIRRIFLGNDPNELLDILNYPNFPLDMWPPNFDPRIQAADSRTTNVNDILIRRAAINSAKEFIENHLLSNDESKQLQGRAIEYLLRKYIEDHYQYIYRGEVANYLSKLSGHEINAQYVTTNIIASARDEGVIIVSTENGYKIPHCYEDCLKWTEHVESQAIPYLQRLEKARNKLLVATNNQFDIVNQNSFPVLYKYLNRKIQLPITNDE
jgi:hypothetical protein